MPLGKGHRGPVMQGALLALALLALVIRIAVPPGFMADPAGGARAGQGRRIRIVADRGIAVTDGGCTFVMGGTLVNPKPGNGGNLSGTGVTGGVTYKLAKGDTILVPAGAPHWVTGVDGGRFVSVTLHMPQTP